MWRNGQVYRPVEDLDLSDKSEEIYIRRDIFAPRATGLFLKFFCMGPGIVHHWSNCNEHIESRKFNI